MRYLTEAANTVNDRSILHSNIKNISRLINVEITKIYVYPGRVG